MDYERLWKTLKAGVSEEIASQMSYLEEIVQDEENEIESTYKEERNNG